MPGKQSNHHTREDVLEALHEAAAQGRVTGVAISAAKPWFFTAMYRHFPTLEAAMIAAGLAEPQVSIAGFTRLQASMGLRWVDLRTRSGLSHKRLRSLEGKGRAPAAEARAIAEAFGCSLEELATP